MGLYSAAEVIAPRAYSAERPDMNVPRRSPMRSRSTRTGDSGKDADLIAVRGDPRSDISVLHHLELVVARGAEYRPAPRRVLAAPAGPGPR